MWRDLKIYFFYIQRLSVHFNQQLIGRRKSVSQLRTLLSNHVSRSARIYPQLMTD
ncbi:hypothetical protein NA56DRAFT_127461 [Hyaloscypha hepaticicola]|uniref:Uncharacterized protein n=1 Tax=Hyaloscypha hepaticicola TaxID=2082293 RepID=A0A2J6Q5A0_9HELO|nr:hypothetical protein NA56DRAFT_127461 [Hyaloscypha hepaticicola]